MSDPELLIEEAIGLYEDSAYQGAYAICKGLLKEEPDNAMALCIYGCAAANLGNHEKGLEALKAALTNDPRLVLAHKVLGQIYFTKGKPEAALVCFSEAVRLSPERSDVHMFMGEVLQSLGKPEQALAAFLQAQSLAPDDPQVQLLIGHLHWKLHNPAEAERTLDRLIKGQPNHTEALNLMGAIRQETHRFEEAGAFYNKVLEIDPNHLTARLNAAMVQFELGEPENAIGHVDHASKQSPSTRLKVLDALIMPVVLRSADEIEFWRSRLRDKFNFLLGSDEHLSDPLNEVLHTQSHLAYQGLNDQKLQKIVAETYAKLSPELIWDSPNLALKRRDAGKIRLGIISSNLKEQTVGYLTAGFIERIDRRKFFVIVITPPTPPDPMSHAIRSSADKVLDVPFNLLEARNAIANANLDVVYYPDIGMGAFTYFLAFSRLAPVQCVGWGHPVTTGISTIDYFISSDWIEPPDADDHYTESLVRLPDVGTFYSAPQKPLTPFDRNKFGLSQNETLILCPQSFYKFHPDFDSVLARLLQEEPDCRLILIKDYNDALNKIFLKRFTESAYPVLERVTFLPPLSHQDFLRLLASADVVLDIHQWSGGRSALECLAMGTPLVHWPGPFMRGRCTSAFYAKMGFRDCIAGSEDEYIAIVKRLIHDQAFNKHARDNIAATNDRIFESEAALRALENFFIEAVREADNR